MKRRTEFKGYVTRTSFDTASGTFVSETVEHGFNEAVPQRSVPAATTEEISAVVTKLPRKKAATAVRLTSSAKRRVSAG